MTCDPFIKNKDSSAQYLLQKVADLVDAAQENGASVFTQISSFATLKEDLLNSLCSSLSAASLGFEAILEELSFLRRNSSKISDERISELFLLKQASLYSNPIEYQQINPQQVELLYEAACSLYYKNLFQKAKEAFSFLLLINTESSSFWLGFAHSNFFLAMYNEALLAYAFALYLNPRNPEAYTCLARCYAFYEDYDNAITAIKAALSLCTKDDSNNFYHNLVQYKIELEISKTKNLLEN